MYDVVTVGSVIRDFFLVSSAFRIISDPQYITGKAECFALGTKIDLDNYHVESGGGATNAAVTFARQGLKVGVIGHVGDDASGAEIVKEIKREKVDVGYIKFDKNSRTASSFILIAKEGQRTILTYRGPLAKFKIADFPFSKINTKWLYITSLAGNFDLLDEIIDFAQKKDFKIAVTPGKAELAAGPARLAKVLAASDVFFLNHEEASQLTGVDYEEKQSIAHALCLLTRGIGVITDGDKGATACNSKHFYHINAHRVKAIDTTGAGDAFASGFIAGLIRFGNLIEPALKLATNNAASVVLSMGAQSGILKKSEELPYTNDLKIKVVQIKS